MQEEVIEDPPDNFDVLDEKETMEAVNQILQKIEKVSNKIKDVDESPLLKPLVATSMKDLDEHCQNLRVRSFLAASSFSIVITFSVVVFPAIFVSYSVLFNLEVNILFCHTMEQVFLIQDQRRIKHLAKL